MINRDKIIIDLTGPQGNAYYLLGLVENLSNQLSLDSKVIIKEMTLGDYENLIQVFDNYFGGFVLMHK